jgi:acetyl-CoA decarbonylase/synthase, CODH/ACS complex subunit delta
MKDTPSGMTFSTLAGSVGGGAQTPGFIGVGKVFLTSRKFLSAEGGFGRIVWMPAELKNQLRDDLVKRFTEAGLPDLMDQIADETTATSALDVRAFMEKVNHPALKMEDMSEYVQGAGDDNAPAPQAGPAAAAKTESALPAASATKDETVQPAAVTAAQVSTADIEEIKKQLTEEIRATLTKDIVGSIIEVLSQKFLGFAPSPAAAAVSVPQFAVAKEEPKKPAVPAAERIGAVKNFAVRKEACESPVWTVKLGATKAEGGTRGKTYNIGGHTCMPFHLWEGEMPNRPLVAMEVFDRVSEKYPPLLKEIYGNLLENPTEMAKVLVDKYGADLISVRLDGTHPERGDRSPQQAVDLVKAVLAAVDVPLIITGHNNFDKNNEVLKAVAQACAGENLLLNWVEQNNYRTIAGAAIAYGHTVVAQSPIDVNISKQLNILLTNMDMKPEKIVIDPMTGAIGYGIEYSYSVMERIRLTGLGGDRMLCGPMILSPGQECTKIKEYKAPESSFPTWGDLGKRAMEWELATAVSFLHAGADILIMYHPEAAMAAKQTITDLLDGRN